MAVIESVRSMELVKERVIEARRVNVSVKLIAFVTSLTLVNIVWILSVRSNATVI